MTKCKIRKFSIKFQKAKVKHQRSKTQVLEKRLKSLERNLNKEENIRFYNIYKKNQKKLLKTLLMMLGYDVMKNQANSFLTLKKTWVLGTNTKVIIGDQEVLKKKKSIF